MEPMTDAEIDRETTELGFIALADLTAIDDPVRITALGAIGKVSTRYGEAYQAEIRIIDADGKPQDTSVTFSGKRFLAALRNSFRELGVVDGWRVRKKPVKIHRTGEQFDTTYAVTE